MLILPLAGNVRKLNSNPDFCVRKLSLIYENLMNWILKMKIILTTLIILLMMPISYAMLDEAVRKIRIKIRSDS